jgi:hypothetical protein
MKGQYAHKRPSPSPELFVAEWIMFWFLLSPIAEIGPICDATLPAFTKPLYAGKDLFFKLAFFLELQVSPE